MAKIHMISLQEWHKELDHLYSDLTGKGMKTRVNEDPNSEAGIAWAKVSRHSISLFQSVPITKCCVIATSATNHISEPEPG